jgi:hypothetical protein
VCSIQWRGPDLVVVGVASKDTAHIQEMVSKQNNKKVGGVHPRGSQGGATSHACPREAQSHKARPH